MNFSSHNSGWVWSFIPLEVGYTTIIFHIMGDDGDMMWDVSLDVELEWIMRVGLVWTSGEWLPTYCYICQTDDQIQPTSGFRGTVVRQTHYTSKNGSHFETYSTLLQIEPIQGNIEEFKTTWNKAGIGVDHTKTYSIGKQNSLATPNEALPNQNEDFLVGQNCTILTEITGLITLICWRLIGCMLFL